MVISCVINIGVSFFVILHSWTKERSNMQDLIDFEIPNINKNNKELNDYFL